MSPDGGDSDKNASQHEQCVYVIQNELGFVKIGIAKDPEKRINMIQIGSPFRMWIRDYKRVPDARRIEKFLHDRFNKYHLRGEWFDIPEDELDFEIPTKVVAGIPNTEVNIEPGRDLTYAWARTFDRLVLALRKKSRYTTAIVDDLREQWREAGDLGRSDDDTDVAEAPPELEEFDEESHDPGEIRCTNCGHYYRFTERACPICGSDDAVADKDPDSSYPF